MRVMVTGGNGFIGEYVVVALVEAGHEPFVFDRQGRSFPVDTFMGDIRDADSVTEAMAHSEGWIHLAGVLGTQETIQNPGPAAGTNIIGGLNVLDAAAQYQVPGVNIAVGNHWMNNTYSISKNTIERFVEMYRVEHDLRVTSVRAFNAYGPGQKVAAPFGESKVRKIMPAFICRALVGSNIEVYGDGEQIMDMIYVEDVARILVAALELTVKDGGQDVIEAGSGVATPVNYIATMVAAEVGSQLGLPPVTLRHTDMRPGEPAHAIVVAENLDMLTVMGCDDLEPLNRGIEKTVDWFHEHWLPEWLSSTNH